MRRILAKIAIKIIRKHFCEGIGVITDNDENIIAYRWTWSKELERELFK